MDEPNVLKLSLGFKPPNNEVVADDDVNGVEVTLALLSAPNKLVAPVLNDDGVAVFESTTSVFGLTPKRLEPNDAALFSSVFVALKLNAGLSNTSTFLTGCCCNIPNEKFDLFCVSVSFLGVERPNENGAASFFLSVSIGFDAAAAASKAGRLNKFSTGLSACFLSCENDSNLSGVVSFSPSLNKLAAPPFKENPLVSLATLTGSATGLNKLAASPLKANPFGASLTSLLSVTVLKLNPATSSFLDPKLPVDPKLLPNEIAEPEPPVVPNLMPLAGGGKTSVGVGVKLGAALEPGRCSSQHRHFVVVSGFDVKHVLQSQFFGLINLESELGGVSCLAPGRCP